MSAKHTTLGSAEIGIVLAEGKRLQHNACAVFILNSVDQRGLEGRVAYVAAKRLGGAVWRNRSKRVLRAAISLAGGPIPGYDIVIVANKRTEAFGSVEVSRALALLFNKVGARTSSGAIEKNNQ